MEFTLRSARKLESKIDKYLQERELNDIALIRAKLDVKDAYSEIAECEKVFKNMFEAKVTLNKIKFEIRSNIAYANHLNGINELLTEKAQLEAINNLCNKIIVKDIAPSIDEVGDLLDIKRKKIELGTPSSFDDIPGKISVSCLSQNFIDSIKKTKHLNSKLIENIEDKLNELNFTSKISLDNKDIDFLKTLEII